MGSRYENLQTRLWGIREGCFFISLLSVAEEERERRGMVPVKVDFVDAVNKAFSKGWISSDYTVKNDTALLSWLLDGAKVTKRVDVSCGVLKPNEYSICKYQDKDNPCSFHFRRRYFDVYKDSRIVRTGILMAYYIYTIN